MCREGSPWFGLQSHACFLNPDSGVFEMCVCPFTSCAVANDGTASCEHTWPVVSIAALLFLGFWALVFGWISAGNRAASLRQTKRSRQSVENWAMRTLFPE